MTFEDKKGNLIRYFAYITPISANDEIVKDKHIYHYGIYYNPDKVEDDLRHIMRWNNTEIRSHIKNNFKREYFHVLNYDSLVEYKGEQYWIDDYLLPFGNPIGTEVIYKLRKRKNGARKDKWRKECCNVCEKDIKICEYYWFLDSKGIVNRAFLGLQSFADEWRKRIGNYFMDKESARAYKEKILCG